MPIVLMILIFPILLAAKPVAALDIYQQLYSSPSLNFDLLNQADPHVIQRDLMPFISKPDGKKQVKQLANGEFRWEDSHKDHLATITQIDNEIQKLASENPAHFANKKINIVFIGGQLQHLWATWNHPISSDVQKKYQGHWLRMSRIMIQEKPEQFEAYTTQYLRKLYANNPGPVVFVDSSVYGFSLSLIGRLASHVIGESQVYGLDFIEGPGNAVRMKLNREGYAKALSYFKDLPFPKKGSVKVHPHGLDAFITEWDARFDSGKYAQLGQDGQPETSFSFVNSQLQNELRSLAFSEIIKKYSSSPKEKNFLASRLKSLLTIKALFKRLDQEQKKSCDGALKIT